MATRKQAKQTPLFVHAIQQLAKKIYETLDFNKAEVKGCLIASSILAFILSFNQWGADTFNLSLGIRNLIIAFIAVAISYFAHFKAHKLMAKEKGTEATYQLYPKTTAISLILGVLTKGYFLFTNIGEVDISYGEKVIGSRWGREHAGPRARAYIALAGIYANIGLIIIAKILMYIFGKNIFLLDLFKFNIWMALISLIPIVISSDLINEMLPHSAVGDALVPTYSWSDKLLPPFDGARIFFTGHLSYILAVGFLVPLIICLIILPIIASIIIAVIAAIAITAYSYWYFNK